VMTILSGLPGMSVYQSYLACED